MSAAQISRVLNKIEGISNEPYSIGFKRISALPKNVRKKIALACVHRGESNDNSMKVFLNGLTNEEFNQWLKSNI